MKKAALALAAFVSALLLASVAPGQAQTSNACAVSAGSYGMIVGGLNGGTCYYIVPNSDGSINATTTPSATPQHVILDSGILTTLTNQLLGITPTDRTITSATGSSQTVMASNASRKGLTVQNTGSANCGVNPTGGTAAIGGAGTITLLPGGSYTPRIPPMSAVTAICTATQPLYANEQ